MSVFGRVWTEAADTFGVKRGCKEPLSPYGRTWGTILDRSEHAILVWGQKFGPLSPAQWTYCADLICHSLAYARKAPSPAERYAYFHTQLTHLLNHETTQEGFEKRAVAEPESNVVLDLLAS